MRVTMLAALVGTLLLLPTDYRVVSAQSLGDRDWSGRFFSLPTVAHRVTITRDRRLITSALQRRATAIARVNAKITCIPHCVRHALLLAG